MFPEHWSPSMADLQAKRENMVRCHIAGRGVRDPRVLDAMRTVPREAFLAPHLAGLAYEDAPLDIEEGQTISQPYIVARMIAALEPDAGARVLEVGTGSGYAAAVLSRVVREVFTIERHAALAALASGRLRALGFDNVTVGHGDGTLGWAEEAPFDGIIVTAGGPQVPMALKSQLAVGGRMVIPVGLDPQRQRLLRVTRTDETHFSEVALEDVRFVPLVGREGWEGEGMLHRAAVPPGGAGARANAD